MKWVNGIQYNGMCLEVKENIVSNKQVKIKLNKVIWKLPVLKVRTKEKHKLFKVIDSRKLLACAFRTWDLCQYPVIL